MHERESPPRRSLRLAGLPAHHSHLQHRFSHGSTGCGMGSIRRGIQAITDMREGKGKATPSPISGRFRLDSPSSYVILNTGLGGQLFGGHRRGRANSSAGGHLPYKQGGGGSAPPSPP